MLRATMIDRIVEDDIATIKTGLENGDAEYLYNCLMSKDGYDNWTLRQIIDEYNSRTWEDA